MLKKTNICKKKSKNIFFFLNSNALAYCPGKAATEIWKKMHAIGSELIYATDGRIFISWTLLTQKKNREKMLFSKNLADGHGEATTKI